MKDDLFSNGGQEAIKDVIKYSRGVSLMVYSREVFTDSSYKVPVHVVIGFVFGHPESSNELQVLISLRNSASIVLYRVFARRCVKRGH